MAVKFLEAAKKQSEKPPKRGFAFAAVLAASLCLASAPAPSPLPQNPYAPFPIASIFPNPYTFCRRTEGICAPDLFIKRNEQLGEYAPLSKSQLKTARELPAGETLARLRWLYESTPVERALLKFPPVAFELDFALAKKSELNSAFGSQPRDTNIVLLNFGKGFPPSQRELVLAHELIHYLSWLGSGWEASYYFEGERVSTMVPVWLAEGLTNWATCRTPGFSCILNRDGTGLKNYHAETYLAVLLELLSGKEALRNALLLGDFMAIQSAFDKEFGNGAFEIFAAKENVSDA
ncbi:MAG: hypothetical protein QXH30_02525, partial [Candidatus Bilamarchaeaceae archaeon]